VEDPVLECLAVAVGAAVIIGTPLGNQHFRGATLPRQDPFSLNFSLPKTSLPNVPWEYSSQPVGMVTSWLIVRLNRWGLIPGTASMGELHRWSRQIGHDGRL